MGRPAVLPLPDDRAKRSIAAVETIAPELPTERGTRPFLAAFIERVHAIIGHPWADREVTDALPKGQYADWPPPTQVFVDYPSVAKDSLFWM